jgi:AcrR family transcriptional regulator
MPRAHTEAEREVIRERLLGSGRERFQRQGLAKVSVAELARDAGIGKGSFYAFFESKEALFLAIQEADEAALREGLRRELESAGSGREAVRALLLFTATRLAEQPFLRLLLDPETVAVLSLRLPAERLAAHREGDAAFFVALIEGWRERGWIREEVDSTLVFEVLTAMFLLSTRGDLMQPAALRRAAAELAEAAAARWCPP